MTEECWLDISPEAEARLFQIAAVADDLAGSHLASAQVGVLMIASNIALMASHEDREKAISGVMASIRATTDNILKSVVTIN